MSSAETCGYLEPSYTCTVYRICLHSNQSSVPYSYKLQSFNSLKWGMKTQKSSNPKQLIEMIVLTIKELKCFVLF